jgi:hypothetical protein
MGYPHRWFMKNKADYATGLWKCETRFQKFLRKLKEFFND